MYINIHNVSGQIEWYVLDQYKANRPTQMLSENLSHSKT